MAHVILVSAPVLRIRIFGFFTLWSGPGAAVIWDLDLDMTIRDDGQVFNNSWLFCVKNNTLNHFDTIAFSSLGVI